ncbi:MAG: tol-pal system protein YbgF, partial [Phenylobacterium sp.]
NTAAGSPAPAPTTAATPAAEDGLTLGRRQLQAGDAAKAEATLTTWLAASAGNPKAGEGAYLRGRARGQQSAWADAAADYITALKGWPATWWAPDAVVELARALGRLGKTAEACQALGELTARYPAAPEGTRRRAAAVGAQSGCGT